MNKTKTAIMVMIVAFVAMIGMTGLAMAGSTTQTYVGDGTYTTSWHGHGGTMNIDTYTSNGQDHLTVDYQRGHTHGYQNGDTNGWTEVDRSVFTVGCDVSISAVTIDNSGNLVAIDAGTDRGMARLSQTVYTDDDVFGYDVDGVASFHRVSANGRDPGVTVYTEAGNAYTVVDVDNMHGYVRIEGGAASGSGYGYAATGQYFDAIARSPGEAVIIGDGDYVGINARVRNDGTYYSSYGNGMVYIELYDEYDHRYDATGYVYAVDLP